LKLTLRIIATTISIPGMPGIKPLLILRGIGNVTHEKNENVYNN